MISFISLETMVEGFDASSSSEDEEAPSVLKKSKKEREEDRRRKEAAMREAEMKLHKPPLLVSSSRTQSHLDDDHLFACFRSYILLWTRVSTTCSFVSSFYMCVAIPWG